MMTRAAAWDEARRLVVCEGLDYAAAAETTGLPLSTLQKRASAEQWKKQAKVSADYNATVRALKAITLEKAIESMRNAETPKDAIDAAQLLYAWKTAEGAYPEHRYTAAQDPKARRAIQVGTLEQLVAFLEREDRHALAALAPHLASFASELERADG